MLQLQNPAKDAQPSTANGSILMHRACAAVLHCCAARFDLARAVSLISLYARSLPPCIDHGSGSLPIPGGCAVQEKSRDPGTHLVVI
jgi:hypothetical protein